MKIRLKKYNNNKLISFILANKKFSISLCLVIAVVLFMLIGPFFVFSKDSTDFVGPPNMPPSPYFWLGTTLLGQDVYSQLVEGAINSFTVGFFAGTIGILIGLIIGFVAGYKGGIIDELLMMLTNIFLVIPTITILIILAAYLPHRGLYIQFVFIGCTSWPWVARSVRSQTMSLRSRQFVDLARISGAGTFDIIIRELAPNMLSYILTAFIVQLSSAIMIAASLDFIGLGPTNEISLGIMMMIAFSNSAIILGNWWWSFFPGLIIVIVVSSLYFINTGLDEVFNPKLKELK